jgi:hypothetical protein
MGAHPFQDIWQFPAAVEIRLPTGSEAFDPSAAGHRVVELPMEVSVQMNWEDQRS